MLSWTKRLIIVAVALLMLLVLIGKFLSFASSRQELNTALSAALGDTRVYAHWPAERTNDGVHVMTIGDPRLPPVVLVHGSPGSIDNWVDLLTQTNVLDHAYVICVDRPGFGESNPGQHESSLALQGQAILQAVRPHLSGRRAVWLGHSFGGPVIARIAIDFPDQVSGLVFAASSVDPDLERVYWYQHLAHTRIISWMLPAVVRTTNREIYTLKPELEEMLAEWPRLQAITDGNYTRRARPFSARRKCRFYSTDDSKRQSISFVE